jgi:hypothetical protein
MDALMHVPPVSRGTLPQFGYGRVADNSPTDRDFAVVSAMAIYRQLTQPLMQNSVVMKLETSPGATIAELEKMATDCEEKAKKEVEPEATKLREEALIYREWITALRSGKWHE